MDALCMAARPALSAILASAVIAVAAYSSAAIGEDVKVTLSGSQEVPPVKTAGTGSGTISISADKSVSGSVTTTGVAGTMAHVHEAPAGKNGPVILPLSKSGDNTWSVPAGAKFNDAQYKSFKAGNLYINVHSAANPGGEIRGQLKPQ
ncbi:MAG TPA: CHRD domain-containing protein [Burkholderiales bacterium]|nr:CHRD domain-containing protein [Burkholderiales bacterium]